MVSEGEGAALQDKGRLGAILKEHPEDKEGVAGALSSESRNLGPGPHSVTHSTVDLGKVNFSLDLSFPA